MCSNASPFGMGLNSGQFGSTLSHFIFCFEPTWASIRTDFSPSFTLLSSVWGSSWTRVGEWVGEVGVDSYLDRGMVSSSFSEWSTARCRPLVWVSYPRNFSTRKNSHDLFLLLSSMTSRILIRLWWYNSVLRFLPCDCTPLAILCKFNFKKWGIFNYLSFVNESLNGYGKGTRLYIFPHRLQSVVAS